MAEFVEFRAEEWVKELEQMERIRLFESKEIKSIVTRRKEFEYKIQRRTKCKEDFLKYIQFEIDLHRIITARRKKTGIKARMAEIEHSQTSRIAKLFKNVIFKFPNDIKLWMSLFKFCEGVKFFVLVSKMLVRMLQFHSNRADLWVFAARWEFKQCKSIDSARQFLTTGLRHHPSSEILYQELFKLELEHLKKMKREVVKKKKYYESWAPDEVTKNIIEGKVVEVIYASAVKTIQTVDFKVSLFKMSKQMRAPINVKSKIFQDIVENHLDKELTWDTIARQEYDGVQCNLKQITGEELMEVDEEESKEKLTLRYRIERSIRVYEEAVKRINSLDMWSFYLDFVIELNNNVKSLPIFKGKLLQNAMQGAMTFGKMAEKYYIEWINRLQKAGGRSKQEKLSEVLKKGTQDYPKSLPIWLSYLRFYFTLDLQKEGMQIFKKAIEHLPDAALLWSVVVRYLLLKSSPEIEEVFQNGIQRGREISRVLRPHYIDWLVQTKGMEEAWKVFRSPEMNIPPCLELYRKMAMLELKQPQPCLEKVRKCHDLACSKFGRRDTSVWLDYVKFELEMGERSRVASVYKKAVLTLKPIQADDFVSKYNKIKVDST